jgi:hypothetical protein
MIELLQNNNAEQNESEFNSIQLDEESVELSKKILRMKYLPNDEQIGLFI